MFEDLFAQSGLSLERLKTFREIVAAGGITAAAGDDSNRQSQFSRQLKELERYFGVELLKPGHGPAELTDRFSPLCHARYRSSGIGRPPRCARPSPNTPGCCRRCFEWRNTESVTDSPDSSRY